MVFAVVCWMGMFTAGSLPPGAANSAMAGPTIAQWVGQSADRIERALGEATASTVLGGTEDLHFLRYYAKAGLVVLYDRSGIAVKVRPAGK